MTSNRESIVKNRFEGDEEAYMKWMREIAAKGGAKKVKKGMAALTPEEQSKQSRERALKRWRKTDATD